MCNEKRLCKKFIISLLIFISLLFSFVEATSFAVLSTNILKEGVYTLSDFKISTDNLYNITNISSTEDAYIIIFDEKYVIMQSIRLSPNIRSFNLIPLKPQYKLVVLGKTEVYIAPREIKQ